MGVRWGIFGLVLQLVLAGSAGAEEILVVINPAAPVDRLSPDQLKEAYLGDAFFWGSVKIHPAELRLPPELYAGFLQAIASMSPERYEVYWIRKVFREGGMPPRPFESAEALLAYVANTPGAVGFVSAADLGGAHVKIAAHLPYDPRPAPRPRAR